jgi:frataxin-like iron-binding protein CyaY
MEIQIDRNEERVNVRAIVIFIENKEFTIYIDKFGELIINKEEYSNKESGIIVRPKVSNEIGLS